jgi:hypothetical protein
MGAVNQKLILAGCVGALEILKTSNFLASEQAGHINGVSLIIDGGETRAL